MTDEGSFPRQDFAKLEAESIGLDLPERATAAPPSRTAPGKAARSYSKTSTRPQY